MQIANRVLFFGILEFPLMILGWVDKLLYLWCCVYLGSLYPTNFFLDISYVRRLGMRQGSKFG